MNNEKHNINTLCSTLSDREIKSLSLSYNPGDGALVEDHPAITDEEKSFLLQWAVSAVSHAENRHKNVGGSWEDGEIVEAHIFIDCIGQTADVDYRFYYGGHEQGECSLNLKEI